VLASLAEGSRSCGGSDDCYATDFTLAAVFYGPVVAVAACVVVLALARVRHPLFIAVPATATIIT